MHYIVFIHLRVNEHLGCLLVLTIVNSAAMNTGVHVYFWIMIFSPYIFPGVAFLDHTAVLFLIFKGNFPLFFKVAILILLHQTLLNEKIISDFLSFP